MTFAPEFVDAKLKKEDYAAHEDEASDPAVSRVAKAFADLMTSAKKFWGLKETAAVGYHRRGDGSHGLSVKTTTVEFTTAAATDSCTVENTFLEQQTTYHIGPYSTSGISWGHVKIIAATPTVKIKCTQVTEDPEYTLSVAVTGLTSGTLALRNKRPRV